MAASPRNNTIEPREDAIDRGADLLRAARAVLAGPFEREDSEFADALFAGLAQAIAKTEDQP